jgi:protein phosphatase 1G
MYRGNAKKSRMSGDMIRHEQRGMSTLVMRVSKDVYLFVSAVAVMEFLSGVDVLYTWMRVYVFVGTLLMIGSWIAKVALSNAMANSNPRQMLAKTDKKTRTGSGGPNELTFVVSEMQGWREQMEDTTISILKMNDPLSTTSMFAIFDGHGGPMVSKICEQSFPLEICRQATRLASTCSLDDLSCILEKSYTEIDSFLQTTGSLKNMRHNGNVPALAQTISRINSQTGETEGIVRENLFDFIGSTAVVTLIRGKEIYVSNAGDSRAILCRGGAAVDLTRDHKPESPRERSRIENAGGRVSIVGPCHRVDFGLNLSRALGDFLYKRNVDLPPSHQKITAVPEIVKETLKDEDEFIILGCDGVFELLSNQQVVNFVRFRLKAGMEPRVIVESLLDECCSKDPQKTLGRGTDNESCILVLLNRFSRGKDGNPK